MIVYSFVILIGILSTSAAPNTFQSLFPRQNRLYSYSLLTTVSTGSQAPKEATSWTLAGRLSVQVYDDFGRARFFLDGLKTHVQSSRGNSSFQDADAVKYLKKPWEVGVCFSSISIDVEPVWVTNMKRALSFNFLLSDAGETSEEPCLYGICIVKYSKIGNKVRKYNSFVEHGPSRVSAYEQRCVPSRAAEPWYRATYAENHGYVMTAERVYEMDDTKGLKSLALTSDFQYSVQINHVLAVTTELSLQFENDLPAEPIQKMNLTEARIQYANHNYTHPHSDILNTTQTYLKDKTYKILQKIARKGIDADNIVRNASLIHSLDFINLLNTMSQLNYTMLRKLFEDVLGTSYELETARNIFLEVLPYVRSDACAKLIRLLVIEQKAKIEDVTLVSLIRKLPFNIVQYNRQLLEELEVFTKLGPEFPQEIRHAGILSYATMVYKTMEVAYDQQYLDDIYAKYLRMYNYCPQYLDRLVWLQGLTNIGKNVKYYLDEIHTDTKKDRHERLWAGLAGLSIWRESTFELTLPILMNDTEHIQLRIVALHAFLSTPLGAKDFLNVHHYIQNCGNDQLKRFWYTTVKNLENNRFYNRYKSASYYIPFIASQVSNTDMKHWATNNYIVSQEPTLDLHGPTFQLLTVGGPWSGPPELIALEFSTGGEQSFNAALYIITEGVSSNIFKRVQKRILESKGFNDTNDGTSLFESLPDVLKSMKVELLQPEKVHIDIVLRIYDKTVYATHINQDKFDSWNAEDLKKSIEDFVRFGSHINQQMVYYPVQMVKNFPTELGTPIRLQSTVMSFTSIRGNLTAPSTEDLTWRNDLHIRYQGTSMVSLSTDGPLQPSEHTARIQRSVVVHLPTKFDISLSPAAKSFELIWTNPSQNGGMAMHSRSQVELETDSLNYVIPVSTKHKKPDEKGGIFFDCEHPITEFEIAKFIASSRSYNFLTSLQPSHIILNSIRVITAPTFGPCGLILPPKQLKAGNQLKLVLKLDEFEWNGGRRYWDDGKIKLSYGLDYYRTFKDDDGKDVPINYLTIKGYTRMVGDGKNGSLSSELIVLPYYFEPSWSQLTMCLKEEHNVTNSQLDLDFTDAPTAYKGHVEFSATHREGAVCFDGADPEDKLSFDFKTRPSIDSGVLKRSLELTSVSQSVNTFPMPPVGDIILQEEDGRATLKVNDTWEMEFESDGVSWLLDSWSSLQTLKRLGFYHECRIQGNLVHTFAGEIIEMKQIYGDNLVVADCTDVSRFALTMRPSSDGVVWQMATYKVKYNWMKDHKDYETVLQSNVELDDLVQTYPRNGDIIFRSKLTGVLVYHRRGAETVVLVPQVYLGAACGLCTGDEYYTK